MTINEQVAKACGFEWQENSHDDDGIEVLQDVHGVGPSWLAFDPDLDANDAIIAAEKFGLLKVKNEGGHGGSIHQWGQGWAVIGLIRCQRIIADTFCAAVCQAIIRLSTGAAP